MHVLVYICSNVRQFQSDHPIHIGSLFIAWPYFVSHDLWLKYNYSNHLHLDLQVLALRLALLRPDPPVRV